MRRILTALVAAIALLSPAGAVEETELTRLMTAYEARGWEGVGRLVVADSGLCTASLVAPRLVLTAAHCIYDDRTGDVVPAREITFQAGWRNGSAQAYRQVRRAIAHPEYDFEAEAGEGRVSNDIALLELDSEIRLSNVQPFETAARPRKGAAVGVVSYAHDRQDQPSLQEVCHVLARRWGSLILSCDVDFGSSGAPVFTIEDGRARIVSVVSAKATIGERPVSIGTNLEKPLADLMDLMAERDGEVGRLVTRGNAANVIVKRPPLAGGGAKFMKP